MLQINESTLVGIADAIRTKEGSTEPIPTVDMAERIANLPSGGGEGYWTVDMMLIPNTIEEVL